MAAECKLTEEIAAKIHALLARGHFRESVAASVGISPETLRNWLRRGARGEEPFAAFADGVTRAEATAELRGLSLVLDAGRKDWRAAEWWLSHKNPKKFHLHVKRQVEEALSAFMAHLESRLSADDFKRVLQAASEFDSSAAAEDDRGG